MFLEEFKASCKDNKLIFIIIILQFTTALTFLNISINGLNTIYFKKTSFNQSLDKNYYELIDNYTGNNEVAFKNEQDNLKRLKDFYHLLIQNENFNYIEMSFQPLYVKDFQGENKFLYGYKHNQNQPPILLDNGYYSYVYSIQINETAITEFNLKLEDGEMFMETDYLYHKDTPIPVLLGYDYMSVYNIGDEIEIDYLQLRTKIKVKGFLSKNSSVINQDTIVYLDRYIVFPSITFNMDPFNSFEKGIQYRAYLNKVNGVIVANELSPNEVQNIINNLTKISSLNNFIIIGSNNDQLDILNLQASKFIDLTVILSILISLFATISLILSICNKFRRNMKNYAIHLINGSTIIYIKKFIALEILFYMLCANALTILFSYIFLGYFYYSTYILLTTVLIIFLTLLIPFKMIHKINVSTLLREE